MTEKKTLIAYEKDGQVVLAAEVYDYDGPYIEVKESELPSHEWFNFWKMNNNKITVNVEKAKIKKEEMLRSIRNYKLAALDTPKLIADDNYLLDPTEENLAAVKKIAERKKQLRDLPAKFNLKNIKTIRALEKYMPKELID